MKQKMRQMKMNVFNIYNYIFFADFLKKQLINLGQIHQIRKI